MTTMITQKFGLKTPLQVRSFDTDVKTLYQKLMLDLIDRNLFAATVYRPNGDIHVIRGDLRYEILGGR